MDLYSLEKTKDYTFFRVVYYYYQLTPRTIRILKIFFFMMLFSLFFVILHFSNDSENICFFIYINISIELIIVLYIESPLTLCAPHSGLNSDGFTPQTFSV